MGSSTNNGSSTTSMRAHKFRHNYHKDYVAMKKGTYDYSKIYRVFYKHGTILETGWYDTQTWGALHKAWLGYVIAKNKGEYDKQIHYASIIQKLQKELDLEESCFPQLGLYAIEDEVDDNSENNVPDDIIDDEPLDGKHF
jgi:hypothetical protein